MIDCPNAEMRDRLPDLVHHQLSAAARAEVEAHVARCDACAAEAVLLRQLREALRATPAVDLSRIVAALPAPRGAVAAAARTGKPGRPAWERFNWRVAAVLAALAVGGGSAAVWGRLNDGRRATDRDLPGGTVAPRVQQVASTNVSIDADLVGASAAELDALLRDLESFDGLPAGEPEPMLPAPNDMEIQP